MQALVVASCRVCFERLEEKNHHLGSLWDFFQKEKYVQQQVSSPKAVCIELGGFFFFFIECLLCIGGIIDFNSK